LFGKGAVEGKLLLSDKSQPRRPLLKLTLRQQITQFDHVLQTGLFPILEDDSEN